MEIIDCLREMRPKDDYDYLCIKVRRYEISMLGEILDRIKKKGSFDVPDTSYDIRKHITKTDVEIWSKIINRIKDSDGWQKED